MICEFCKKELNSPYKMVILNSGKILGFCKHRCQSHFKLKRKIKTK
jgi:ribosomal protein L24E